MLQNNLAGKRQVYKNEARMLLTLADGHVKTVCKIYLFKVVQNAKLALKRHLQPFPSTPGIFKYIKIFKGFFFLNVFLSSLNFDNLMP